jgi:hypothetical protein
MNNNHNETSDGEAQAKPEVIKLGLDLHARQVTECRPLDGSTPKPAQKWDPWNLLIQVEWVKAGIKVYSCYEAGACGYWYHRGLIKCGALNYVVEPRPLENQRSKHQKTDRLDARALLSNLESYLRGNCHAITIVAVPSLSAAETYSTSGYVLHGGETNTKQIVILGFIWRVFLADKLRVSGFERRFRIAHWRPVRSHHAPSGWAAVTGSTSEASKPERASRLSSRLSKPADD